MKILWLLAFTVILSTPSWACVQKPVASETTQTTQNPTSKIPEAKILQLTIKPKDELTWDDKKGTVTFNADSGRMTDHFHYYLFDAKEFAKMLGSKTLKTPILVSYKVLTEDDKRWVPDNKNIPQPHGGFTSTTVRCQLVKIEVTKDKSE